MFKNNFYISLSDVEYYQKAGSVLKKVPLKSILSLCETNLLDDGKKGKHGQIFPYINNVLGKEYWPSGIIYNDSVSFCDLDYITKECADIIFNSFEEICKIFPSLLAIQYSSSYFQKDKEKNGLHIYFYTYELDNTEFYNENRLMYMTLLQSIFKVTGIDLRKPQIDEETIVDVHNMNMYQRINLYYSPYKWNENSIPFDKRCISNSIDKLEEKFGYLFEKKNKKQYINTSTSEYDGVYEMCEINKDKLLVNSDLYVGKYSGCQLRYRIAYIGNILFGEEKSKEWCDRYFYCKEGSIWQNGRHYADQLVLKWLENNGYIKNNLSEDYYYSGDGIEIKTYLNEEQYDNIRQCIDNHKVITIYGDPGIGKTTCLGRIAKEIKGVVLTPYNVMRKLYENVGLEIVDVYNRNSFDFENNGCVMVYDQLPKVYDKIIRKTIFIDESHILYKDREYRNTLIKVLDILKNWDGKIVIISATPLRETKILKSEVELKFWKSRPIINGIFKVVENLNKMKYLENTIIMQNLNSERYSHICLFGNRGTRMIYDNLILKYGREFHNNVNIFHRSYAELGDIERIQNKEILDKKINLGTSLVYNGVNFKNEGSNILVIIEYEEGKSNWCDIIQACTRIRKSHVSLYVIAAQESENEYSLDERIDDAKKLYELGIDKNLIGYNNNFVENEDVIRELNVFKTEESGINYCFEKINSIGWIKLKYNDEDFEISGLNKNLLIQKIDNIIKKELNGLELDEDEINIKKDGKEYYDNTINLINDICNNYGITENEIISLNNSEHINSKNNNKTVTLATTVSHIRYNTISCYDDDNYWKVIENHFQKLYEGNTMYKIRMNDLEKIKECRKKYRDFFDDLELAQTNGYGNVKGMIDKMIEDNNIKNTEKSKNRAESGKKGGKNGSPKKKCVVGDKFPDNMMKKYNMKPGMEFESATEISKYANVSQKTISNWFRNSYVEKR